MRRAVLITIGVFLFLFITNFLSVISASEGTTYFEEDFESGYDGWERIQGLVFFPKTQKLIHYEGNSAFRMTGIVLKQQGFASQYKHVVDIPVIPNMVFEFAYYYLFKHASYVGYLLEFNNNKIAYYISHFYGDYVNLPLVYLIQYKMEAVRTWIFHNVSIYADYRQAFGSVPPDLRITSVSLVIGDPYHIQYNFTKRLQTAFFDSIKFYQDSKNYPPNPPSRPSGPGEGVINTSYQYSITASDINNDQIRICCQYDKNSSVWSEWIGSGESATFEFRWMKPGTYTIQAFVQDESGANSSMSDPLTVYITNETKPLTVLAPNGDEGWFLGRNYTITWSTTKVSGDEVTIEISNNQITRTIVANTKNNGSYLWSIPPDLPPGINYKIKISSVAQPFIYDFSDRSFALYPYLDVFIDARDIDSTDWTPMINDTVMLIARISYTGTQPLNTTINFFLSELNQTTPSHDHIGPFSQLLIKPQTTVEASWQPTHLGDYELSVEIINTEQEEFQSSNNIAIATKQIRVGATDDDLVCIPPIETIRISDGSTMLIPLKVICYKNNLKNVDIRVIEPNDFEVHTSTPPQNLTAEIPKEFYISITPSALPNNLSSVQKEIIVKAIGSSSTTGDDWTSEAQYIVIEVYRPTSLVAEVAVATLLLGGILTFCSVVVTETGKYKIFSFLSLLIPLFTHIRSEEVLENFVRGQIYGYIKTNPGSHYNNIKKSLDIGNGTLAHHLNMLEKTGLIKSRQEGLRYRLFYPTEMTFPAVRKYMLSEFQLMLLQFIKNKPGISQKEIVGLQNESQQTVSYNLKELEKVQEITSMKKHGKKFYYLVPKKQASPS